MIKDIDKYGIGSPDKKYIEFIYRLFKSKLMSVVKYDNETQGEKEEIIKEALNAYYYDPFFKKIYDMNINILRENKEILGED